MTTNAPFELAETSVAVVALGAFSPAAFSPRWFYDNGIVGQVELDASSVDVISPPFASMSLGWLQVRVDEGRLQLSTLDPAEYERLRDACVATLRTVSPLSLSGLGINRDVHVAIESLDRWHAVGDELAPKAFWSNHLSHPGMRNVTVWGLREDDLVGYIQIQVEPSLKFPQSVYVGSNHHFALRRDPVKPEPRANAWNTVAPEEEATPEKVGVALEVLAAEWDESIQRVDGIVRDLTH